MENVPLHSPHPSTLIHPSTSTTRKDHHRISAAETPLASIDFGINVQERIALQTPKAQNRQALSVQQENAAFEIPDIETMPRNTRTKTKKQLHEPPASHLRDSSSSLSSPSEASSPDSNEASTSRNRPQRTQPPKMNGSESQNTKTRKQPKRLAAVEIPAVPPPKTTSGSKRKQPSNARIASTLDAVDASASPNPRAKKITRTSHSPTRSSSSSVPQEVDPKSITPARKRAQAVPKTEKPRVKSKRTAKTTRRKSAPLNAVQSSTPPRRPQTLDPLPDSPDSDTDDPLLLVGTESWVSVPWKPMYFKRSTSPEIKAEPQDLNMDVFRDTSSAHVPHMELTQALVTDINAASVVSQNTVEGLGSLNPQVPPEAGPVGEIATTPMDTEDGLQNSSALQMELGDESILDFEVPVRLDSPPPRRRRSSAVSQRQPTPAPGGEEDTGLGHGTNGISSIRPSTPPSQRTRSYPYIAPYPSPRFVGHDLGSLSPEKGRGPVRGAQPNMDSDEEDFALTKSKNHTVMEAPNPETSMGAAPATLTNGTPSRKGLTLSEAEALCDDTPSRSKSKDQDLVPASESDRSMESPENHPNSVDVSKEDGVGAHTDQESLLMGENGVLNLSELDDRMEEDEDERIMMEIQRELTVDLEDEEPSTTADLSIGQNMDYSFENQHDEGASIAITYNAAGQAIDDDPEIKNEIDDVLQNSMVVDDAGDWTDEEEDENDPPVVEISSKNHEAAARAAAILKLHHDWIEASKRPNLKRRRSSMSVGGFDSPRSMSTPIGRQHSPVSRFQIKRSGLAGSPIQPSLLQQMAAEMSPPKGSAKKAGLGRFASQDIVGPSTPVHNEGTSKSRSNMFRTPIFKPPTIIINPASTVTSQRYIRTYSGEEPTRWMKEDWKHLERCLLAERQRMADEGRYNSPEDVDMEDINVDTVVEKFLEEVNFDEEDLVDEWDVDKIRRRVIALQVRHSPDPQVARSIVSSPSMVVPFTPQIRQRTNHGRSASLAQDTLTSRVRSAMASAPTLLLAHRYSHLYDEASAIAGLPTSSQNTSSTPKQNQDRAKAPTGSRIPVLSSSRHVKPVPPPPPTPKADAPQTPPPVEDTPSATSRVLGFLGLGNILRSSIRSVTKGKAKASDSDKIVPIEEGQTTVIKPRLPTPKPIPESPYNLETMSQEDLNHVEPQSPQLPAPLMHPKDLVELNHVPLPEPQRPASSRKPRVSGGSVKELVKTFEELEDENDRERQRIKEVVRRGRRVVGAGGKSVRRVPSNLSTASVISASDFERSYGDDSMDSSFGTQDNSMDMSMLTDGDISMEGIVQRRKSLLALE